MIQYTPEISHHKFEMVQRQLEMMGNFGLLELLEEAQKKIVKAFVLEVQELVGAF